MSFSKTWSYVRKHSKDLSLFGKLMAGNQILLVQTGNTPIQLRSSTLGKHWGQSELLKVWLFVDHRTKASLGGFPRVYQPAMLGYTKGYVFQTLSRTNVWKWSFSMTKHTILISRWCNPHVLLDDDSLLHLYYSGYWFKATQIFGGLFVSVADDAKTLYWFPSDGGFSAPPDFLSSHPRGWPACPEQNRGCYGIFLIFLQWKQPVKLSYFQQGPCLWYYVDTVFSSGARPTHHSFYVRR